MTAVRDNSSIVMRIEHSFAFKRWFKQSQAHAATKIDATVANLRAAKHRFESWIKPLGRLVLYIEAIVDVAVRIAIERGRDDCADDARKFLQFICDERLVQLAMLADAAHETSLIIRTCDVENWDTSEASEMLSSWRSRVTFLFCQDGVLTTESFTNFMLQFLKKPHTVVVDGRPKTFGSPAGVAEAVIKRCLSRMRCWHKVALSVLSAEFPSFEVWQAFNIFRLKPVSVATDVPAAEHFERISKAFGIDKTQLKVQYVDHVHLAASIKGTRRFERRGLALGSEEVESPCF